MRMGYGLDKKDSNELSIFTDLSESLAVIDELNYVKIYKGRIAASNALSENGKKQPITEIGKENIVGVELLVDVTSKIVQFFSLTSSVKGCGQTGKVQERLDE